MKIPKKPINFVDFKLRNKRNLKYKKEIICFLKNNFPERGADWCSKKLDISLSCISNLCYRNKIYVSKNRFLKIKKQNMRVALVASIFKRNNRPDNYFKVNPRQFIDINTKEVAYILGLIWSDGTLAKKEKNKGSNAISVSMVKNDVANIKDTFFKTGEWSCWDIKQKHFGFKCQTRTTVSTCNKTLHDFLIDNCYYTKSNASACKILSKIPEHLKHYWFRGLSDGDGSFTFYKRTKNSYGFYFSVASSNKQDWTYMINLSKKLNFNLNINIAKNEGELFEKRKKKYKKLYNINLGEGGSCARTTSNLGAKIFGDYIYQGYPEDGIGLKRKYDVYLNGVKYVLEREKFRLNVLLKRKAKLDERIFKLKAKIEKRKLKFSTI